MTIATATTSTTFEILGREFELDELNDIATHGMAQGVSGFIYSTDLHNTFEANEETIFSYLDEHAFDTGEQSGLHIVINAVTKRNNDAFYTMQDVKEMAVWLFVELFAVELLQRNGHPGWV